MANPALGRKYACHNCGTKFYDLNKPEPRCPKCGTPPEAQTMDAAPKSARGGAKRGRAAAPVYEPKVEEDDAPFEDEEGGAFDDEEAPLEDDEAGFDDEEGGDGEEEGGGDEEE